MAVGAKTMFTVQVALRARVWPAQLSVSAKSPVMASVPKVTGPVPLLVRVRICAVDCVPTCWEGNVKLVAEREMEGWAVVLAVSSGVCQMPRP